jgi:methionine synthase II (cobalamin-independent)
MIFIKRCVLLGGFPPRVPRVRCRSDHSVFAQMVRPENVIAGTDCGLGARIHLQIASAKLATLAEGAALASRELWP